MVLYSLLSPWFVSASWWLGPRLRQPFPLWCPNYGVQLWIFRLVSAGPGKEDISHFLQLVKSRPLRGPGFWPYDQVDHPSLARVPSSDQRLSECHPSTWTLVCLRAGSPWKWITLSEDLGNDLAVPAVNHWLLWCHRWKVTHGLIA